MLFWIIVTAITVIACAALYYASLGRPVNASPIAAGDPVNSHHRLQLAEIEADIRTGRLSQAEALAAKAELAREVLRQQKEAGAPVDGASADRKILPLATLGIAVLAIGTYSFIGNPQLPAHPLASRPEVAVQNIDLGDAITRIEARLAQVPDDLRGWTVIAPVYMQTGRYDDAVRAYRAINQLSEPSPDSRTDLAEAMMLAAGGVANDEARALLEQAAAADSSHFRSRFYLASEAMRLGDFADAAERWKALLAIHISDDSWRPAAEQGLAAAQAGLAADAPSDSADQKEMIEAMVEGLSARLAEEGGTVAEWTQLVRSYTVLGDKAAAQQAYDQARAAYPSAVDRAELDGLAASAGLKLEVSQP